MRKKTRIAVLYNEPISGSATDDIAGIPVNGSNGHGNHRPKNANGNPAQIDMSEHGVLDEMEDIRGALNAMGYEAITLNVDSNIYRLIDFLREETPDLIFNLVECVENESDQEMNVAGLYELLKIPYTGAGPLTLGLALNKPRVKEVLTYHGIRTPRYQVFSNPNKIELDPKLTFPLIVKPSREDASVGISNESVVRNLVDLRRRVRFILEEYEQPALVEQYIEGREVNVAIMGNKRPIILPISEIDFSGLTNDMPKIVSYDAKWVEGTVEFAGTQGICPANLTQEETTVLRDIAMKCYRVIGCRDYARVDIRLTRNRTPYVLEVNPNPDISDDAGFARSAKVYGLDFHQVAGKIVEYAMERHN